MREVWHTTFLNVRPTTPTLASYCIFRKTLGGLVREKANIFVASYTVHFSHPATTMHFQPRKIVRLLSRSTILYIQLNIDTAAISKSPLFPDANPERALSVN